MKKIKDEKLLHKTDLTKSSGETVKLLPGVLREEYVRCGRSNCRCRSGTSDTLHGPYFYRYWREAGRLKKVYVPKIHVDEVRAACNSWRSQRRREKQMRRRYEEAIQQLREMADMQRSLKLQGSRRRSR